MPECPHCHSDLTAGEIAEEHRYLYGGATHYERTVGVQIQGVYDGTLFYQCPDCGGKWHRWPVGHPYRERAERFI